jgi:hypothetical protein
MYIYIYIYIHTHSSDCTTIVLDLALLPNNTASETLLNKLRAVRSVDWILPLGRRHGGDGRMCDIGQNVLQSCFQTESSSQPQVLPHSTFSHSSRRPLLEM